MPDETSLELFDDERADTQIRKVWHDGRWFYSIIDVIGFLTGSARPRKYWNDLKTRLAQEGSELSAKIGQLKMPSSDGKSYLTDAADTETLLRLIQSIPSPRAEPFKQWLARVGTERIAELEDPALAADRLRREYQRLGYSPEGIKARPGNILAPPGGTTELAGRGPGEGRDFALLPEGLSHGTFGVP